MSEHRANRRPTERLRQTALHLIGLGAMLAMLRPPFIGSLITDGIPDPPIVRITYDVSIVILGCLFALKAIGRHSRRRTERGRAGGSLRFSTSLGLCAVAGVLGLNIGQVSQWDGVIFFSFSTIVFCIGFAALFAGWFSVLRGIERNRIAALVMGAFVISHLFGLIDLLPRAWAPWVGIIYPLLAIVPLALKLRTERVSLEEPAALADRAQGFQEPDPLVQTRQFQRLQWCAIVTILVELFCGALMRARWAHGGVNYTPQSHNIYTYLISAALGILFWCVARRSKTASECSLIISGIGLIGFTASMILFAFGQVRGVGMFLTGLYSSLLAYAIALISFWELYGKHKSTSSATFFLVIYGVFSSLTSFLIPALFDSLNVNLADSLYPISIIVSLLIALGMCVMLFSSMFMYRNFLTEISAHVSKNLGPDPEPTSIDSAERRERAMDLIAEEFALTKREREAASLMAQGYTAGRVAEEMTLTEATVKGYAKSIYRKMDIHRKDELIEKVNEAENRL